MMLLRLKSGLLLLTIVFYFFLAISSSSNACTVFKNSNGENILFGNVENEDPSLVYELHFNPPDESNGYFGNFFLKGANGYIGGGMNDQGLCFDVAALPNHPAFNGKPHSDLMIYLLNECKTVDDALRFFDNYFWPGHNTNHIMIMDKTGKSVVVEIIENTLYVYYNNEGTQVMTNYALADPEIRLGDYPCPRFETATSMLDTLDITISSFQKVCEKVSHAYYGALYGNIYNPKTLDIHFFNPNINNSKITTFNLNNELEKGYHFYELKNNEILSAITTTRVKNFALSQNNPNPFCETTTFTLSLKTETLISIGIFDQYGRLVQLLHKGQMPQGQYTLSWNAGLIPAGIYFCRINADGIVETRKWIKN